MRYQWFGSISLQQGVGVCWPVFSTVAPRGTASTSVVAMPRTMPQCHRYRFALCSETFHRRKSISGMYLWS